VSEAETHDSSSQPHSLTHTLQSTHRAQAETHDSSSQPHSLTHTLQ